MIRSVSVADVLVLDCVGDFFTPRRQERQEKRGWELGCVSRGIRRMIQCRVVVGRWGGYPAGVLFVPLVRCEDKVRLLGGSDETEI